MRRIKQDELLKIQDFFAGAKQGLDKHKHYEVMQLWSELDIPQVIKKKTFAHRFTSSGKLFIGVKAAALANDLQFMKSELLAKLNERIKSINEKLTQLENYNQPSLKLVQKIIFELR
jgi:hypothetical protein